MCIRDRTKTDRVDARTIAAMLLSDAGLKPYTDTVYHNEELKLSLIHIWQQKSAGLLVDETNKPAH